MKVMERKMSGQSTVIGWHFAGLTLRDGSPLPAKGTTLRHTGPVVPCKSGYHLSERALDALQYAPGWMVARVQGGGTIAPHGEPIDKYACSERTGLTDYRDATAVIVRLTRTWALRAIRDYAADAMDAAGLNEQAASLRNLHDNCDLRNAASVAMDAACVAADVARNAAGVAADVARNAACVAADVARNAACVAGNVAGAGVAADVAWEAAWDAAWDVANTELEAALLELMEARAAIAKATGGDKCSVNP